ncbi:MAG: YggS family pyridoxal phosphate-dependent enzyme [Actinobacteria bacterium]|nr:YggS family pyridoxal phosphate-dependent enzyme [Actinomycetota bacterium]
MSVRKEEIKNALDSVESRIQKAAKSVGRDRDEITLIVVTKTYPSSDVEILRELGVVDFGENREDEGREKSAEVLGTWHFQGQIQSNKIAAIGRWANVVHSLDSSRHLEKFESSLPAEKILSVFLQVSLDGQSDRGGVLPQNLEDLAKTVMNTSHLKLVGIMAVAPLKENPKAAFSRLAQIHLDFRSKFPLASNLSAGMSNDFEEAIAHGATHIRIGSSILGVRSPQR